MKRIKPIKIIPNDKIKVQALLDKGIKVFACFHHSDVIYQITSIGKEEFVTYSRNTITEEVYFTRLGNAININTTDLVLFTGSSQGIKSLKKNKTPASKARSNYVGIELEFISSEPSLKLIEKLMLNKLSNYVTVTKDNSIDIDDGGFETEIKILAREAIVFQVLKKVLSIIPRGSYVNDSCGLHVHLDMRNRDKETAYKSLYRSLPYLTERVASSRIDNEFCRLNHDDDLESFEDSLSEDRYQAINPHSYQKHKTLEIRLKESTLDFTEASSWIKDLIDIVNGKKVNRKGIPFVEELLQINAS